DGWSARRQQPSEGDDEGVRVIATKDELDRKVEGQTIASRWLETLAAHPDNVALRSKDGDRWIEGTFADLRARVARAAAGLRTLGVGPGDRVLLMMRNIPEFHVVDLATMFCGATAVSIYNSSPPEHVAPRGRPTTPPPPGRSPTGPGTAAPPLRSSRTSASQSGSSPCATSCPSSST